MCKNKLSRVKRARARKYVPATTAKCIKYNYKSFLLQTGKWLAGIIITLILQPYIENLVFLIKILVRSYLDFFL